MTSSTAALVSRAAAVRAAFAAASAAVSLGAGSNAGGEIDGMTDVELLAAGAELQALTRATDALRARVAGAVAERSRASLGSEGIAKQAGYARAALMLADLWQISVPEAARLCAVGLAIVGRRSLGGEPLPSRFPAVGESVDSGNLGLDAAAHIVRELEGAAPRCSAEARLAAERLLVEQAPELTVEELGRLARLVRDRLDEDGAEPRDEVRRRRRSLKISMTSEGMLHVDWYLDPVEGGLVKAGIDALVGEQLRTGDGESLPDDERTLEQLRSDAGVEIFRHAATCGSSAGDLPAITMVVRMTLESLLTGLGRAEIDGIDETTSATAARRLAVDAELVPVVLGGRGEVLDLGASRRLFTKAQRLAFAERDGGCAWGGCSRPPSYTEAHHIEWWSRGGGSDLANGILLCSHHHHRVHQDGWEIRIHDNVPFFVPPPHVDLSRRPRRGGRVDLGRLRV